MQKALVSAVAVLALGLPLVAQTTITCSSQNGQRHFCPANTSNGVRLKREQSNNVCQQGSTWSYNQRGIQVNGGCSADFEVSESNGSNANGSGYDNNNGYGNNSNNGYGNNGPNRDNNGNRYPDNNNNTNNGNNGNNNNTNNGNNGNNSNNSNNGYGVNGSNGQSRQGSPVLPSGTQLTVRLDQAVRTAEVNQGDFIPASLVNDVSVNGDVIATAGTPVQAVVQSAQGSPLDLRLDSMTVNGRTYTLATNAVHGLRDSADQGTSNQSTKRQLGDLLGSVTGGSQVPSGTVFNFRLTAPAHSNGNVRDRGPVRNQ